MKFYRDKNHIYFWTKIKDNKLNTIHFDSNGIRFYKNGLWHNSKNAAYILNGYKEFYLNDFYFGYNKDFTKKSWRKFVKLKVFK